MALASQLIKWDPTTTTTGRFFGRRTNPYYFSDPVPQPRESEQLKPFLNKIPLETTPSLSSDGEDDADEELEANLLPVERR